MSTAAITLQHSELMATLGQSRAEAVDGVRLGTAAGSGSFLAGNFSGICWRTWACDLQLLLRLLPPRPLLHLLPVPPQGRQYAPQRVHHHRPDGE